MIDYHDYVGEYVKITDKSGKIIEGQIIGYQVGAIEEKDYDSIDVAQIDEGYSIEVSIPDIKKFEVIKEK